jgi:transcriptional regulator with XRE-family HTH domain
VVGKARSGSTDATVPSDQDAGALRDLGDAMRARRRQLGLKLTDVAAGSGLSVPFLSQVETSFATPSLTSLFAIARVLETTPERLLAGPGPAAVVLTRREEGREYVVTDAARPARRRQITGLGEPFSVAEYVVVAGEDLGGFHASTGRELIHVTAGRLVVDMDDGTDVVSHELVAGDSLVYPTSVRHRWRHAGRATTHFVHVVGAPT